MFCNEKKQVLNLDINDSLIIGSGFYSNVYRVNQDTCFKYYNRYPEDYTENHLKYIRSLDFDCLYKIYDLVYKNDRLNGYLMKYYESIKLENKPFSYLYESYLEAIKLFARLSRNKILLYDMHEKNIIPTEDLIVLIDCDNKFNLCSSEDSFNENKRFYATALGCLVASRFNVSLNERNKIISFIIESLSNQTDDIKSKKLIKTLGETYV